MTRPGRLVGRGTGAARRVLARGVLGATVVAASAVVAACASGAGGGGSRAAEPPPARSRPAAPPSAQRSPAPSSGLVIVPGVGTHATALHVGQQLMISGAAGDEVHVRNAAVLASGPTGLRAAAAGTTTVDVQRRPRCDPGRLCSQLIQQVGTVTVTVTP